jgi:dTDP-glucose 4,6-dehydratase
MKVLVTGGAGFIGSNYVKRRLEQGSDNLQQLIILDDLTYAGTLENLKSSLEDPRVKFVKGDICDRKLVEELFDGVDEVIHFAAESHVDRSISSSDEFIRTNVSGTNNLLNVLRTHPKARFLHVSTDEVYGTIDQGSWTESSPLKPNSPYAASKASSDLLALSYQKTYGLDRMISRCCNNYGPNQFPEKIIPLFITNLIAGRKLPVYGSGGNIREWIHVDDHCMALDKILAGGLSGQVYNIGSGIELSNLELTHFLLESFGKDKTEISFVKDRLGHDSRYSLDSSRIEKEFDFTPRVTFIEGLESTIKWYLNNKDWWKSKIIH